MLIGYLSDERYVAIADGLLLFERDGEAIPARSCANGAVYADLTPGRYEVSVNAHGFGPKRVTVDVRPGSAHQFRLLSNTLLGYAWPKCVKSGEKSEFRVHSPEQYRISLWRYGLEKELVRPIGWFDEHGPGATLQITPDGDYTQTGAQWNKFGYSSPVHKQYMTAPERSGLYYFHAETDTGKFFSFPWVVAPAKPQAKTAVLMSDMNWNAYNNFGGRSNYIHPHGLLPAPTLNARLELPRYTDPEHINYGGTEYDPLSFDRPEPINHVPRDTQATDPIAGRAPCHIAPTEWRCLAWLQREGFDYDVWSESQLHFDELDLTQYKVLILGPHPEYWSVKMYERVKKWVFEEGGRLMYLGGNGLNCEVEFLDRQTAIYRNEDARELRDESKGLESRFHQRHESEANLLGVVYDERGIMTAAPYEVVDDAHWVFAGTGLKNGDIFGTESLHERVPGGASGHETDKRSKSSPPDTRLLARGLNADGGGAEMCLHVTPHGGAVFATGSICWIASLLVDGGVSSVTANVLRRFLR